MKHIKILLVLLFILLMTVSTFAAEGDVYYVADGGTGDGSSAKSAGGSLADAYTTLADGGTVVVCGPYTISETFNQITHGGKLTITSVYGGVDYRKTDSAALIFCASMYLGGETEFCNIVMNSGSTYPIIYAYNQPAIFGNGIECGRVNGSSQNVSIIGGLYKAQGSQSSNLTINSGTWQRVRGGPGAGGTTNYTVNFTVNGGTFIEGVILGSSRPADGSGSFSGEINATIDGGEFRQGMVAASLADGDAFSGNVNLTINGGTFYSKLAVSSTDLGTYYGSFNVTINGGDFAHLTEFVGPANLAGTMTSSISGTVDLAAKETGTYTLQNPIRNDGADPWLFYHDGYYYYTSTTSSSSVKLTRARNIGDLMYYSGTTIYTPEEGQAWSNSTWSPTVVHYTDEEVGEGNGGWYLYFGAEDNTDVSDVNHRMYVLKCLDGDNLLGAWGNPITGEVNLPQRVSAPDIADFDNTWAAGQGDIRINGKVYTIYVTEVNKHTADYYQTINIISMKTPWEFEGTSSVICVPEYDWEMVGYGKIYQDGVFTGKWAPKVVEAATPVYGDDGSVFLVYSGSNYTRDEYCLGQLKFLGGDPMVKSNWQKKSTPILSQGNGVRGTGSASYVTDTSGQSWVCYNAYLDSDETRTRHAMVEPYIATSKGVVIGDGSGIAAAETKTYQAAVNPMSLAEKMSGFNSVYVYGEMTDNGARLSFNPVAGAYAYRIWRDNTRLDSVSSASGVFEYIDTAMPMGAHTYKVEVRQRSVTGSMSTMTTATTRVTNYEGLSYGDIDKDGDVDVLDGLLLLKSVLNKTTEATVIDVLHLFKCIF